MTTIDRAAIFKTVGGRRAYREVSTAGLENSGPIDTPTLGVEPYQSVCGTTQKESCSNIGAPMNAEGISILVVADEAADREVLMRCLEKRGYQVTPAEGAGQALALVESQPFDLMLLDLRMPEMDGLEVLKRVRRMYTASALPVILVTAKGSSGDVVDALGLGANDYVRKPVDYPVLFLRVDAQIMRKRASDEQRALNQTLERRVDERNAQSEVSSPPREELSKCKQIDETKRRKIDQIRTIIPGNFDWLWETDDQFRFTFVSERIGEIPNLRPEHMLGKTLWELEKTDPVQSQFWHQHKADLEARKIIQGFRYRASGPEGCTFYLKIDGVPFFDAGGVFLGYRGIGIDETAKERARKAENQLAAIMKNIPLILFRRIQKADGKVSYPYVSTEINQDTERGKRLLCNRFFGAVHQEDAEHFNEALARSACDLELLNIEYRIVLDGGEVKWIHCGAQPHRLESGDIIWDGMLLDITERKNLQAQLLHSQKLESVGRLAAGIAHEINTPTQYVGDNTRFLQDAFADLLNLQQTYTRLLETARRGSVMPELIAETEAALEEADLEYLIEEIPKAVEQSLEGLKKISQIVTAMKEFSHPGSQEKESADLNRVIETTITVARNEWKYVAEVVTNFDENLPGVQCLPGELGQVFLNLIVNAAHAIADVVGDAADGKGTITISTRQVGDAAEIRISDTGPGVPAPLQHKIFDPFFTSKEVGKGTGQGLAIARSVIVDKHGGTLTLDSKRSRGATFVIHLPLDEPLAEQRAVAR
jgi:signal transduction histidine kinase/DNA-binding NarL/FixJ family response regulator